MLVLRYRFRIKEYLKKNKKNYRQIVQHISMGLNVGVCSEVWVDIFFDCLLSH